jgi:siroheme synthase (precorrin-2 oxidase/ferrochelatase)
MKKIAIIGGNALFTSKIEQILKYGDLDIVVNNLDVKNELRERALQDSKSLEQVITVSERQCYIKPTSKYHK